jgi:hypothetical protein
MILDQLTVDRAAFEAGTGWQLKPEGACMGDVCIPLSEPVGSTVEVESVARQMGLPLVADESHGIWALGPWSGNERTLVSAEAPDLELPDVDGQPFRLSSLRGQKVLLIAWAPY